MLWNGIAFTGLRVTRDLMHHGSHLGPRMARCQPILVQTWINQLLGLERHPDDQVMQFFRRFNTPNGKSPRPDSAGLRRCSGSTKLVLPHLHCGILHSKSCDKTQTHVPIIPDPSKYAPASMYQQVCTCRMRQYGNMETTKATPVYASASVVH